MQAHLLRIVLDLLNKCHEWEKCAESNTKCAIAVNKGICASEILEIVDKHLPGYIKEHEDLYSDRN